MSRRVLDGVAGVEKFMSEHDRGKFLVRGIVILFDYYVVDQSRNFVFLIPTGKGVGLSVTVCTKHL